MSDVVISGLDLREMIRAVSFAAPRSDRHPTAYQAIHLQTRDGRLHAMATDGHRLAYISRPYRAAHGSGLPFASVAIEGAAALYEAGRCRDDVGLTWHADALEVRGGRLDGPIKLATVDGGKLPRAYENDPALFITEWVGELRGSADKWARHLAHLESSGLGGPWRGMRIAVRGGALELANPGEAEQPIGRLVGTWVGGEAIGPQGVSRRYLLEAIACAPGAEVVLRFGADLGSPISVLAPEDPAWACALMPMRFDAMTPPLRLVHGRTNT